MRLFLAIVALLYCKVLSAQEPRISRSTLNSGGHEMKSPSITLKASLAQTIIQAVSSNPVKNHQGFWYLYTSLKNGTTPYRAGIPLMYVRLYPNPGNGLINLELLEIPGTVSCRILDLAGKALSHHTFQGGTQKLDLSLLSPGTYVIRLLHRDWSYSGLWIKGD
jgi:hypothetical protein